MPLTNSGDVLGIGQQIVPWIALIVAIGSALLSFLSYRITQTQAVERKKSITCVLDDLWFSKKSDGSRSYAFDVSMINQASVANSIVRAELKISYSIPSGHEVRIRCPETEGQLPVRLDSFQAVSKTFRFELRADALSSAARIEDHMIEFTYGSGEMHILHPGLIIERKPCSDEKSSS
jgi:hypothetical protein